MKTILLLLAVAVSAAACDDDSDNGRSSKTAAVPNTAVEGQWRITSFHDSGDDETSNFTGYIFEFDPNNIITATNGSNNYSGSWSVTDDDSSDDDNDQYDDIDFNISFTTPADFAELSEDWEIISISDTRIDLQHVSGGNGGTDLLTFEKV